MRQDGRGEWAVLARVIARGSGGSPCLESFTLKSLATRLASKQQPLDRMGGCSPFSVTTVVETLDGDFKVLIQGERGRRRTQYQVWTADDYESLFSFDANNNGTIGA